MTNFDDLPASWSASSIGEICDYVQRGKSPRYADKSDLPVINQKCIRWDHIDARHLKFIHKEQECELGEERYLQVGDILWNSTGTGTIGRASVFRGLVGFTRAVADSHVTVVRTSHYDSALLHAWIASPFIQKRLEGMFSGSTNQVELPRSEVLATPLPVPPKAEQRRIAAKLEALQSRTRLARMALAAIPTLLDHYRQSVLAAAFRGELTAAWRSSKAARMPVSVALTSVETPPRPARYGSRSDVVSSGDYALAVGNPETELPDGWQWVPLVDIARLESGHTPSRQHPEWWGGEVPWVSIPDARDNHGRIIEKTTINTNQLGLANSAARLLPAETVCLCRTAASIGYVTIFGRPMATSQDFVNWTCTSAIDPHWLKYLLMAEYQALLRFSKGSAHKTIYFPEVVSFHVGLPPIEEQRRIVEIVECQMRRIDELTIVVGAALTNCSNLDQATLATAFRGELVPQDPTDEPASELLARIKAQPHVAPQRSPRIPGKRGRPSKGATLMKSLLEALADQSDWVSAQQAFSLAGIADGINTDAIEKLYEEMRKNLDRIEIKRRGNEDWLRLKPSGKAG